MFLAREMRMKLFVIALLFSLPIAASELELSEPGVYWEMKRTVAPIYPRSAVREGTCGYVRVHHNIDEKGRVKKIEIIKSVPPEIFDKATIRALKQFRYKPTPANPDRQPVRVEFRMEFDISTERDQGANKIHYDR